MRRGRLATADGRATIHWVKYGTGPLPLVYLPGGGGGLCTPEEALPQIAWWLRRKPADAYRILYLSRREPLCPSQDFEVQADDVIWALERLAAGRSILEAQSAGGPVAQIVAARRPDLVAGLVQTSTTAHLDDHARALISAWRTLLAEERFDDFLTAAHGAMWKPRTLSLLRPFSQLLRESRKAQPGERMLRILEALLELDNRALLPCIPQPALVVGGADDLIFRASLQRQLAEALPQSRLILYEGQGHGHDVENWGTYERDVLAFCRAVYRGQPPTAQQAG